MRIAPVDRTSVGAWVAMRERLWPDAEPGELAEEVGSFLAGTYPLIELVLLAHGAAEPVGFIELSLRQYSDGCTSSPVPHLEAWYVEPGSRRRGIGTRLLAASEHWARERGYTELASDSLVENAISRAAHAAFGFEEVETLVKFRKSLVGGN